MVEALTHSPFWKSMAILVVEDDAQNGVDHIDGHRTVALAISPYARRGAIDSTFYSQPSMVKTVELMLGLPALSMFDLVAHDMRASFLDPGQAPDLTPYRALVPAQSIYDVNARVGALHGPARAAALASSRMRLDIPDAAPSDVLNRILWHDARGWNTPYPACAPVAVLPDVGGSPRRRAREAGWGGFHRGAPPVAERRAGARRAPSRYGMTMHVLAGDVGGTNARLAIVGRGTRRRCASCRNATIASADYDGLGTIVRAFLDEAGARPAQRVRSDCGSRGGRRGAGHQPAVDGGSRRRWRGRSASSGSD